MNHNVLIKSVSLSVMLLIWSALPVWANYSPISSDIQSKSAICSLDNPESILNVLKAGEKDRTFTYSSNGIASTEKFYVYLPPAPVVKSLSLQQSTSGGELGDVKMAFRMGTEPGDYSSGFDAYTHDGPGDLPVRLNDLTLQDAVVRVQANSTNYTLVNLNLASQTMEQNFYANRFYTKPNAISPSFVSIYFSFKETVQWCEMEQGPAKPAKPSASPASSSWSTSPQTISVSSAGAEEIYYKITTTQSKDGEPANPPSPGDPQSDDSSVSNGKITLQADPGVYKKFKIALRAVNSEGWSDTATYSYSIDKLPKPVGPVSVSPQSGTQTSGTSMELSLSSANSTEIRYVLKSSLDGEPDSPSETEVLSSSTKALDGKITLTTNPEEEKTVKIRFVGYRANNPEGDRFGEVSQVKTYVLKGEYVQPGQVSVNPGSGTFTSRPSLSVVSSDSTDIYYVHTLDGSDPEFPADMYLIPSLKGPSSNWLAPGKQGQQATLKVRFRGYNSNSNEFGPVSNIFSYIIDQRSTGGGGGEGTPPPDNRGKAECEAGGGTWFEIFGHGFCQNSSGSGDSPLTRSQARSQSGQEVTERTFRSDLNSFCPAKKFYVVDNSTEPMCVSGLIDTFLNPEATVKTTDNSPYLATRTSGDTLILELMNGDDSLNVQLHLKILEIRTTENDDDLIEIGKYGDLIFTTRNLDISMRFASGDWSKLDGAMRVSGRDIKEVVSHQGKSRGVVRYSSYNPELGQIDRLYRPSLVLETNQTCDVGEVFADYPGLDICYDSSGKRQILIPFLHHYDEFYNDLTGNGGDVFLDPFTGVIRYEESKAIWAGIPSSILRHDGYFSGNSMHYELEDDMNGNSLPELRIGKDGYSQFIYSLFP